MRAGLIYLAVLLPFSVVAQLVPRQQKHIDSLVSELHIARKDSARILLMHDISYAYMQVSPDKSLEFADGALQLSKKQPEKKWQAASNGVVALAYQSKSDFKRAVEYSEKALSLYDKDKHSRRVAAIYTNLSSIYLSMAQYPEALDNGFRALRIYENSNSEKNHAIVLENIGNIYYEQADYPKTLEYYKQSLKISKKLRNIHDIARSTGNLARVFNAQGDHKKALQYLFEALEVNEKAGLDNSVQINLANIGNTYTTMKQFGKAVEYHKRALAISERLGSKSGIAVNYGNLGSTYLEIEKTLVAAKRPEVLDHTNLKKAIDNLQKAVVICREIGFRGPLAEFNETLMEAQRMAGDYEAAFSILVENSAVKDSLFSLNSKKELADLDAKREIELKNKNLLIDKVQLQIKKLETANDRFLYLAGISLLCILIVALYSYFRKKTKVQQDTMDNIIHIQAHVIRGPVASILGLTDLLNRSDPSDPSNKELLDGIYESAQVLDDAILKVAREHKISDNNPL